MGFALQVLGHHVSSAVPWVNLNLIFFINAGPEIATNVTVGTDKVTLSCSISAPQLAITGHKWIHKEKTLQEDSSSGASTSYT